MVPTYNESEGIGRKMISVPILGIKTNKVHVSFIRLVNLQASHGEIH